jgi:hypothetical protein
MDWVAEITPGRFYGPVHSDAIRHLTEGGGVVGRAPLFRRCLPGDDERLKLELAAANEAVRLAHEQVMELETSLIRAGQDRDEAAKRGDTRAAALQARLDAAQREKRAQEAELQALRGSAAQAASETAERDCRIGELEAEAEGLRQENARRQEEWQRSAHALHAELAGVRAEIEEQARTVERERSLGTVLRTTSEAARREAGEMRDRLAGAEREADALRDQVAALEKERDAALHGAARAEREREAAARELAAARSPSEPRHGRGAVLEAEVLPPEEAPSAPPPREPPPVEAPERVKGKPALSLADIERQARLELERLGANGSAFFAKKK